MLPEYPRCVWRVPSGEARVWGSLREVQCIRQHGYSLWALPEEMDSEVEVQDPRTRNGQGFGQCCTKVLKDEAAISSPGSLGQGTLGRALQER